MPKLKWRTTSLIIKALKRKQQHHQQKANSKTSRMAKDPSPKPPSLTAELQTLEVSAAPQPEWCDSEINSKRLTASRRLNSPQDDSTRKLSKVKTQTPESNAKAQNEKEESQRQIEAESSSSSNESSKPT
jgi:hypothetical protein